MPSRRRFLQTAGIATSAGLAATSFLGATEEGQTAPLPASVAELKSRRHQAVPISAEERIARLENARRFMATNKQDAILLMEGTSLNYFTGMRWWGGERLFAMVLPTRPRRFLYAPRSKKAAPVNRSPRPPSVNLWTCVSGRRMRAPMRKWHKDSEIEGLPPVR